MKNETTTHVNIVLNAINNYRHSNFGSHRDAQGVI